MPDTTRSKPGADIFACAGLPLSEIWTITGSGENGLSAKEAAQRLEADGPNVIHAARQEKEWLLLLSHFRNPLVILLLIAAVISFSSGEAVSAMIIMVIILASVGLDYWQERDSRNAAADLQHTLANKATVLRDGTYVEVPASQLCRGDIVQLQAGRIIPADGRMIWGRDCFINQSSLTGESFPAEKNEGVIENGAGLDSLRNMLFMGSSMISGNCRMVITQTGKATELGKIAGTLSRRAPINGFERGIRNFGWLILKVSAILVLFIFVVNAYRHQDLLQSFLFAIAIAVGLTPELLPMIMSVTMSRGATRMAGQGVIVKQVTAIPNFGSMEILCTDKTGTLTEDRIALVCSVTPDGTASKEVEELAYLNSYFQTGVTSPLDTAILDCKVAVPVDCTKLDEIPFDFSRKRVSVVVRIKNEMLLITKGAPEEIFKTCGMSPAAIEVASQQYTLLSGQGFRVLAVATRALSTTGPYSIADECQLQLAGFVAFLDPPKADVKQVIDALQEMGIAIKILTGDNHLVTQAVCEKIGLNVTHILQGTEMDALNDEALAQRIRHTTIFTRVLPEQKNRIIQLLKKQHAVVGYLGDGINDAPALKTADIGITVNSAVDVARDAADVILTRKDLKVLQDGIREGRKTYCNTMKYIRMTLSSNFGNMFSMAAAAMILPFLPMLPVQVLVNNFLYDTSQLAIPADTADDEQLRIPRQWDLPSLQRFMLWFGLLSSLFDLLTFYLLYHHFKTSPALFRTGWFMESLATQILVVFIIRTDRVPFYKSKPAGALVWSALACLLLGWVLPYGILGRYMGFTPPSWYIILYIAVLVVLYLVSAELLKSALLRFYGNKKAPQERRREKAVI